MVRGTRLQSGRPAQVSCIVFVHVFYLCRVRSIASSVPSAARLQEYPRATSRLRSACVR